MSDLPRSDAQTDCADELERVTTTLRQSLQAASDEFRTDHRGGARMAAWAALEYLSAIGIPAHLTAPLFKLGIALNELDKSGSLPALFTPARHDGRPRLGDPELAFRGSLAAAMTVLMRSGMRRDAAARKVGRVLIACGGRSVPWRDIRRWRDSAMSGSSDDVDASVYAGYAFNPLLPQFGPAVAAEGMVRAALTTQGSEKLAARPPVKNPKKPAS